MGQMTGVMTSAKRKKKKALLSSQCMINTDRELEFSELHGFLSCRFTIEAA